jgi:hypothetical protein
LNSEREKTQIFLKKLLKRTDIKDEDRESIEKVLLFFKNDDLKGKKDWKEFVQKIKALEKGLYKKYPVNGYQYELRVSKVLTSINSLTLKLVGDNFSTWVFEVSEYKDSESQIFFSSIEGDMDDIEMSTLDEAFQYCEKLFESKDFQNFVLEVEQVNK